MSSPSSCGCCAAMPPLEPIDNRPGLPALAYRIGVYGSFFQRLLDQIYAVQLPSGPNAGAQPLTALTTRAADDATIALLDAWAVMADVLTFYQERIANEGYLRTATERRSILELARAIGYELAPGVASRVLLQFTVDNIIGAPLPGTSGVSISPYNTGMVDIPAGTQAQSIPTGGQQPQIFETAADFVARVERNAMQPRLERTPDLALCNGKLYLLGTSSGFRKGTYTNLPAAQIYLLNPATAIGAKATQVAAVEMNQIYLQGTSTNVKQGDRVLLVGFQGTTIKTQNFVVNDVETDSTMGTTCLSFSDTDLPLPTFEPYRYPAVDLGTQQLALTEANVAAKILNFSVTEGDLDAFMVSNDWDPAQLAAVVNNPAAPVDNLYGAFAMRSTCGFFGNNAVPWNSLPATSSQRGNQYAKSWDSQNGGRGCLIWMDSQGNEYADATCYLERTFPQILPNSWALFEAPNVGAASYQVTSVAEKALADFGLTGRSTGLNLAISAQTKGIQMGSPAMASAAAGTVDLFAIGFDGHLYHRWQGTDNKWQGPVNLGGDALVNSPAAVSWGTNRIDVFACGSDGNLYHWYTEGGNQWQGPENRGGDGKLAGSPSAVSRQANSLDIVAIGSDGNLYHFRWDNQWFGPDNWGPGNLINNPSAVSLGAAGFAVYALGKEGDLYQSIWFSWGGRVGPQAMALGYNPAALVDSPSAVWLDDFGAFAVAVRIASGQVVLFSDASILGWDFGIWVPVLVMDGQFTGSPVAVSFFGQIEIFAVGANGDLYSAAWVITWLAFQEGDAKNLGGGGNLNGSPTALWTASGALAAAVIGAAGHWLYTDWDGGGFSALDDLGNGNMVPFLVRNTTAYVQSAWLQLAGVPVIDDIPAGTQSVMLDSMVLGLVAGQPVALSGMRSDAPAVAANEMQTIQSVAHASGYTTLTFQNNLQYGYRRASLTMSANVTAATNGATTQETLGSGDASQTNQSFTLKKSPLTFVPAATPTGVASTLEVSVSSVQWEEAPSFYGLDSSDQEYVVRLADDGTVNVTLGDPAARPKSGQQNITATYRTGIGTSGNVAANSITTLNSRPPGLRGVTNPVPAAGGGDPQALRDARVNAPLTVLTLDRVVSLADYENFARAFAGVGKAQAIALWNGERQLVHVTIAASDGTPMAKASSLYTTLLGAIDDLHDPVQTFMLAGYQALAFNLTVALLIDETNYTAADVQAAVIAALTEAFLWETRAFAQAVTEAEIVTLIQSTPGVLACNLSQLYLTSDANGPKQKEPPAFLAASPARWYHGVIQPAQLLLLNPSGVTLKEMAP